jgi:hypothetical protein
VLALLLSLIWLIASPPNSRVGTAGLVAIFLISASAVVGALKPYWEQWKPASRIGVAVSAAAGATLLLLTLLQILPGGNKQEVQPAAVTSCIQQVKALSKDYPPVPGNDLTGRVWVTSTRATTVVVADSQSTWTCNLEPDIATSTAGKATIDNPEPADFSVAYWQNSDGTFTWWGGGALPAGAESVKFTFPDGIVVYAEARDGYWVMQHLTQTEYKWDDHKPIIVKVAGPTSYGGGGHSATLPLRWGDDTCDQVNHGC